MAKKKATKKRKSKVEKPFNSGTMTKAAFFNMLRQLLRRRSIFWKPISETKQAAKRPYNGPNKRQKFEYKCSECNNYFSGTEISIHHIKEVGKLQDYEDLPDFVKNLFCEKDGLRALCNNCHDKIHKNEENGKET